MSNDLVNGCFELFGAMFVFNHCWVLTRRKSSAGVSSLSLAYFIGWGFWNLYYYPSLDQQLSFYAGILLSIANLIYLVLVIKCRRVK